MFYKYLNEKTCEKFLLEMLEEKYIHFSDPETLNDRFDCSYSFDEKTIMNFPIKENSWETIFSFIMEEGGEIDDLFVDANAKTLGDIFSHLEGRISPNILQQVKSLLIRALQNVKSTNLVYSMSEVNDSLLMWAHYGDNLKGAVLCLDPKKDPKVFSNARKIKYSKKRSLSNYMAQLTKSVDWKYEKEWRIISYAGREKNCCRTPAIVAVIIGYNISIKLANELLKFCIQNNMPMFFAEPDDKLYKINITPHYIPDFNIVNNGYDALIDTITHNKKRYKSI